MKITEPTPAFPNLDASWVLDFFRIHFTLSVVSFQCCCCLSNIMLLEMVFSYSLVHIWALIKMIGDFGPETDLQSLIFISLVSMPRTALDRMHSRLISFFFSRISFVVCILDLLTFIISPFRKNCKMKTVTEIIFCSIVFIYLFSLLLFLMVFLLLYRPKWNGGLTITHYLCSSRRKKINKYNII